MAYLTASSRSWSAAGVLSVRPHHQDVHVERHQAAWVTGTDGRECLVGEGAVQYDRGSDRLDGFGGGQRYHVGQHAQAAM
ncbi:hypothetical protein ACFYVK_30505 [Streptomyces chartreusis]|uniref:hypothetical protein n=1 Tax=Streptomyces chartreusis TaxID=1969 RepID=UPI003691BCB6